MFNQLIDFNKNNQSNLLIDKSNNIFNIFNKHQNHFTHNITIDPIIVNPLNPNNSIMNTIIS